LGYELDRHHRSGEGGNLRNDLTQVSPHLPTLWLRVVGLNLRQYIQVWIEHAKDKRVINARETAVAARGIAGDQEEGGGERTRGGPG
jgi:hypothetical protein